MLRRLLILTFTCKFVQSWEIVVISTGARMKLSINKVHWLLGHLNDNATRKTAKHLGWEITCGKMMPCEHCVETKAMQKKCLERK